MSHTKVSRFNYSIILLILFFSLLAINKQSVNGIPVDTPPTHITNINNLFNVPAGSNSHQPVNGVTVINDDLPQQTGAIWSKEANRIDLTNKFSATMWLNFGGNAGVAADGMTFTMQNDPIGANFIQTGGDKAVIGQRLGVWAEPFVESTNKQIDLKTAIQNSFAVEFDTNDNTNWDTTGPVKNSESGSLLPPGTNYTFSTPSISGDHIAYGFPADNSTYDVGIKGFKPWIGSASYNYTSVMLHKGTQSFGNKYLSDGKWHKFVVNWDPTTNSLNYQFDSLAAVNVSLNPSTVFKSNLVYWGFTGKTGDRSELNQVVFEKVSNIPITSQSYKIYHKNTDGSKGAEVTLDNPAKPSEKLLGVILANNSNTSLAPWNDVALRHRNQGVNTTQGIGYTGDGITINGKSISNPDGSSTGLFKTPKLDINGNPIETSTIRNAVDTDVFGTNDQYGYGVNTGNIPIGGQTVINMNMMAMDPTPTDGVTNLGRATNIRLDGGTASDTSSLMTYVTSVPKLKLDASFLDTSKEKPVTIDKGKPLTLKGSWSQTSVTGNIDKNALGTLHYAIDGGTDQTISQNNTGGDLVASIPTDGLAMNADHELKIYMTNAGYNQKSEVITIHFQIKGGKLQFTKVNDPIGFNSVVVGQNVTATRKGTDWAPTISDSRGKGGHWDLYASSTGLTRTSDQKALAGGLIYVNGQSTKNITSTPIIVASKDTTTDNDEVTKVDWSSDQGILLKVGADAYKGDYSGTINWTLGNTPKP